jgi:2-polyprenyl-3-methyl-5-hydroxy-6-metoxy-1,4-benzoquinol methylase
LRLGTSVGGIGCGTGRLEPHLAAKGLSPHGIDLSPEMIRVARRDFPGFSFEVSDVRELPGLSRWMGAPGNARPAGHASD